MSQNLVSSLGPYRHMVVPLRGRVTRRGGLQAIGGVTMEPWSLVIFLSTSDTLSNQYNDALPQHRPQINETTSLTAELNEVFPLSKLFCLRKLTNTEVGCKTKTSPRETQDIGLLTPDTTVIQSTDNIKV